MIDISDFFDTLQKFAPTNYASGSLQAPAWGIKSSTGPVPASLTEEGFVLLVREFVAVDAKELKGTIWSPAN